MRRVFFRILVLVLTSIFSFCIGQNTETNLVEQYENIKVLLIVDDNYGSSFVSGDEHIKSIKQQFEDFGWKMTIAGLKDTIVPCDWGNKTLGAKPIIVICKISEKINPAEFDAIIILPGRGLPNLINNSVALNLLKRANQEGIIIAAWCRGVRLLAAADIIRGKNIIGHFDYFDEYEAVGANYIKYSFMWDNGKKIFQNVTSPIRDGNIITTVRSLYYRNEMCLLIKESIEEKIATKKY